MRADTEGLLDLEDMISEYMDTVGNEDSVLGLLQESADEFVADLSKLPKPVSGIRKPGYTHLINTFSARQSSQHHDIEVGWGKYYGPMVERGTKKMSARAHMVPLWNANRDKYYESMKKKFNF